MAIERQKLGLGLLDLDGREERREAKQLGGVHRAGLRCAIRSRLAAAWATAGGIG